MESRAFGGTSLRVSEVGLGCARLGGIFQQDVRPFLDLVAAAVDSGITFFDTADMYSQGESETLLGRALRGKRDRVVIATKAGYRLPARRRLLSRLKPLVRPLIRALGLRREQFPASVRGEPTQEFSPAYLRRAVEGSLRRLRTDRIDLFQLHSPPADVIERAEWLEALEALRREGKILHWGISCDTADAALAALRQPGAASIQIPLSLIERRVAEAALPAARERGVAVIAREVLANGLLAKDAASVDLARYCSSPEEQALRSQQIAHHRRTAESSGVTLLQLALQYARTLPGVSVMLIGASTSEQLRGSLRAMESAPPAAALAFGA